MEARLETVAVFMSRQEMGMVVPLEKLTFSLGLQCLALLVILFSLLAPLITECQEIY